MSYRPQYHVSPPLGRLNDPNGMFIDGHELHVYYQHDPGFPHAVKRTGWAHAVVDLAQPGRPRHYPNALYPDRAYDAHGCYSGGAVRDGEDVWLFYTGNLKQGQRRIPSQNRVKVQNLGPEGGYYRVDSANPLIADHEPGYTGHFRDPMITADPQGGWRMVLGAQREDETGAVVIYRSQDLEHWDFAGEITFSAQPGQVPQGYMWECPNLLSMQDVVTGEQLDLLVLCPQYPGSDECCYVVGKLRGLEFEVLEGWRYVDYGHEFYAPQLVAFERGALMMAWMGLPAKDDKPTVEAEGWVHTLTVPRRVELHNRHLVQAPVWENVPGSVTLELSEGLCHEMWSGDHLCLRVAFGNGQLEVTRWVDGEPQVRVAPCAPGKALVLADASAVELFADHGRVAMSIPVFDPAGMSEWQWRS